MGYDGWKDGSSYLFAALQEEEIRRRTWTTEKRRKFEEKESRKNLKKRSTAQVRVKFAS